MKNIVLAATLVLGSAVAAPAAVLDFDSVGDCSGGGIVTITTETAGTSCAVGNTPNSTDGLLLRRADTFSQVRATFSSLVNLVSVQLGDFGADNDTVFLSVFASDDTLLGTDSLSGLGDTMGTVSVAAANISYAIFGSQPNDIGFITADNLRFTVQDTPPIPLPAGGVLLLTGLAALALKRRRTS